MIKKIKGVLLNHYGVMGNINRNKKEHVRKNGGLYWFRYRVHSHAWRIGMNIAFLAPELLPNWGGAGMDAIELLKF